MPFWKKSEDPWDIDPAKRQGVNPAEREPGLADILREEWDALWTEQQEKKAALRLPPELCPWCGKDMEQGFLAGGRGIWWYRGIPNAKNKWLGGGPENTMRVDTDGILYTYHTAWYCPSCKKMAVDAADLRTQAEENALYSQGTGALAEQQNEQEIKED